MEKLKHASVRIPLSSGRYNISGPCLINTSYDRTCADVKCFCITPTYVWSQDHKIAQSIFEHDRMLSQHRSWILLNIDVRTFTFFAHPEKNIFCILAPSRSILFFRPIISPLPLGAGKVKPAPSTSVKLVQPTSSQQPSYAPVELIMFVHFISHKTHFRGGP